MKELTWEKILVSQQQDFIARFKYYVQEFWLESSGYPRVSEQYLLSKVIFSDPSYHNNYYKYHNNYYDVCCELIQIDLICSFYWEDKDCEICFQEYIHRFCLEMSWKYYQEDENDWYCGESEDFETNYQADQYMNHYIGKLGEEAVNLYLGGLITGVDYKRYPHGDGGVYLNLKKDKNIGIQVKTHALFRIDTQTKVYDDLDDEEVFLSFFYNISTSIQEVKWRVTQDELKKNKVCIFVLLLSFVEGERTSSQPELLMAGWKPTQMINNPNCIRMEDLFYMGGIRSYLESL
ncbi:hypothetical protein [Lyngbya sp. PCC 8106]|uniref:hypothetical protein n=1 Tax=Lyngbya sp. (strain PCC 8106) TaxID=313612 RepID=UPI0000EA8A3E|nr:hypothetical protein [Lyngbya sp. PCC 8106]EAW37185.1 TPR repeat protein [Lyngbya sp. PCC 8106]